MPTYEYTCEACGYEFEREQRISEDPIRTCPKCKKRKVKRLVGSGNFILKGGGWYADLYSGPSNSSKSSGSAGKKDGDSSTKKKDGDKKAKPSTEKKGGSKSSKAKKAG